MNYSYIMGIKDIKSLRENGFNIKTYGENYGVSFTDDQIKIFEEFICKNLQNGFWNEYLGKEKIFIFKFETGEIKRYVLNIQNEKEILKLCSKFADNNFESITKMLKNNKFYLETYFKNNFINFLIKAKKSTYANSNIKKVESSRVGSSDYHYEEMLENTKYIYHDTYFGGTKFIGEEVVYCDDNKPVWGMNYYGVTLDESLGEETMDNVLRPALMKVGEDKNIIPVRGIAKFENNGYTYTFKTTGTIERFDGIEQIYKGNNLIYELHCSGGMIV